MHDRLHVLLDQMKGYVATSLRLSALVDEILTSRPAVSKVFFCHLSASFSSTGTGFPLLEASPFLPAPTYSRRSLSPSLTLKQETAMSIQDSGGGGEAINSYRNNVPFTNTSWTSY